MQIWHLTHDAPRSPRPVSPGKQVTITIGTRPIEPGQSVWATYCVKRPAGLKEERRVEAVWRHNEGTSSYWQVELGPFARGDRVSYAVSGRSADIEVAGPIDSFIVGARLHLALLWHQHQPLYKDLAHPSAVGSYLHPWVRLHAIRDYYSMASLVAQHPGVHLTINLTPILLWQILDYVEGGATDRALELTIKPAETLAGTERQQLLATFFDADWHHQIFPHPRYEELFIQRRAGLPFTAQDLRDLQMWFNLAWFGQDLRAGDVRLVTGESVSVRRYVEQGRDFSVADIRAMVADQYKVMRAVVPLHRQLQEQGHVEIATSPFAHPILPLLLDTDRATIDRPGARLPRRFARPEDAEAQVQLAFDLYHRCFGRPPRGMWPAEGAVGQSVIPVLARHGVHWIASDRGVLSRSGHWGYDAADPDVLCQAYRAQEDGYVLSLFFRDTELSDAVGFRYAAFSDPAAAARDFLEQVKERFARRVSADGRVLTVALDGENAWGAYRDDGRPFLGALYTLLAADSEVDTVTPSDYLTGDPERGISAHPVQEQERLYELFTGSWIDESGSAPGVDLGTWIGEEEENAGWELLTQVRDAVERVGAVPQATTSDLLALYAAEGSDWFWWFGDDQDSGSDAEFDDLFRTHLANVYHFLHVDPPARLAQHIVPRAVIWTFMRPVDQIQPGDRLTVRTNCPGVLTWRYDSGGHETAPLSPSGGVMARVQRHHLTLGPFPPEAREVRFGFQCTHTDCDGQRICCKRDEHVVQITRHAGDSAT
jgi:alpha-amylase/alpha-mannosidase (GH57 family)